MSSATLWGWAPVWADQLRHIPSGLHDLHSPLQNWILRDPGLELLHQVDALIEADRRNHLASVTGSSIRIEVHFQTKGVMLHRSIVGRRGPFLDNLARSSQRCLFVAPALLRGLLLRALQSARCGKPRGSIVAKKIAVKNAVKQASVASEWLFSS